MWLKVLGLFILCSLSFNTSASPFGHDNKNTLPSVQQVNQVSSIPFSMTLSENATLTSDLCLAGNTDANEVACCHLDTCSVFLIIPLQSPANFVFSKPRSNAISWLDEPLSSLKKPPKFISV